MFRGDTATPIITSPLRPENSRRFQSDDQRGVVTLTFHVTVTDSASIHTGDWMRMASRGNSLLFLFVKTTRPNAC
jgi:hypothetical protein